MKSFGVLDLSRTGKVALPRKPSQVNAGPGGDT
jgi:hypothetical protein